MNASGQTEASHDHAEQRFMKESGVKMEQDRQTLGRLRNMTAIYLTCGDWILLLYRQGSRVVNNVWTGSAGGHFEPDELNDARACVLRELGEELGLDTAALQNLTMRYVTLRRTAAEIRQNYYFFAELPDGMERELDSNEGILKWFRLDEVDGLPMPFTAKYVVQHWLSTGRFTDCIYGGVTTAEGVVFTEMPVF